MKFWILVLFLAGCARVPLMDPAKAFLPPTPAPELRDSYPIETLREALSRTLKARNLPLELNFAGRVVSREDYRHALEALAPELESFDRFHAFVLANFDFHPVYGGEKEGEVFSTGYFDATLKGSRHATEKFSEPLYRTPSDMVTIDLKAFSDRYPDLKPLQSLVLEQKSKAPQWRGRLVKDAAIPHVVPYYERSEIQRGRPLKGLEIAWVDPIDAFFLEIQGSGTVELENGRRIRVGYDAQNGSPYTPIGRFLTDRIPKEQMSMQRIRSYLSTLPRDQQQDIFDKNASYVFFREFEGEAVTYCGAAATGMRTIASDQGLFPKGTLAFFEIEEPVGEGESWVPKPRWVFDSDTGGAIRGGGRVDLFTGHGAEAERVAGVMKRKGKLWVLAPKVEFLAKLRK